MATYRSRNALVGPVTSEAITAVDLPRTSLCQRGYRSDDVDALLHRLAYELGERSRQLDLAHAENQRIKKALRTWHEERRRSGG